jgi:hypothetical protein
MSQQPTSSSTRRPYTGSCHCGRTQYIAHLTLPPTDLSPHPDPTSTVRIRKCNCTACHKMGLFHVRLMDSPNDFVLLLAGDDDNDDAERAPAKEERGKGRLKGLQDLGDYTCNDGLIHFYFCRACGVRCFAFMGEGETTAVDLDGRKQRVWRPKAEGWKEGRNATGYLSVNASSLDAGQEGLDLRVWTESKWVAYLDYLGEGAKGEEGGVGKEDRYGRPHEGGMY